MTFNYQPYPFSITNKKLAKDLKAKYETSKEKNTGSSTEDTKGINDTESSLSVLDNIALTSDPKFTEYFKEYFKEYKNCEQAAQAVFENILAQGEMSDEAIKNALDEWKASNENVSDATYNAMKQRIEEAKKEYESSDVSVEKTSKTLLTEIWHLDANYITEENISNINKTADGKVTDFYYQGIRYSIRYDENGNITKTIRQAFDDEDRITYQGVDNWKDGNMFNQVEYKYEYDENGNQIQTERDAHYCGTEGNYTSILSEYFGNNNAMYIDMPASDIKKNSDGKITDFVWGGIKYSLRYDENGNVTKTIVQTFAEDGKIKTQDITNIDENGVKVKESHTYDENEVDNTSEAMQAVNRVRKLYTSKTGDLSESQDSRSKFYSFLQNETIEKLSAAGVTRNDILNLFDELFPGAMNYLLNDLGDNETAQSLHNKYGILYPEEVIYVE